MKAEDALVRGKLYLDEATENLTFDEFLWAFEETWFGVGWVLNAISSEPQLKPRLGEKGSLPVEGSLTAILTRISGAPKEASIIGEMEALRLRLDNVKEKADLSEEMTEKIVELTFRAWELHDICSLRLNITDERLEGHLLLKESSPGKVSSRTMERRTMLKLLALGGIGVFQACTGQRSEVVLTTSNAEVDEEGVDKVHRAANVHDIEPLNGMHWPTADPFLFLAAHRDDYPAGNGELGPDASLGGRHLGRDFEGKDGWRMYHGQTVPGFPRHPHRGFETVTFVRSGLLDHSDSMGAKARYGAGDVQWLTAGGGIQHSEMFPLVNEDGPNPLEFFQIWVNLPRANKMVDPYFRMLWNETIPRVIEADDAGRLTELVLAAGSYRGHEPPAPPPNSWASQPESDLAIWSLRMEAGVHFRLPAVKAGTRRYLYVHKGEGVDVAGERVGNRHRVEVREAGEVALINGAGESEILLLQARPIAEPVAQRGPFVMNTQDEIRQAYQDYQSTQFGGWPWQGGGPVHAKQEGRFAVLLDGTLDKPT